MTYSRTFLLQHRHRCSFVGGVGGGCVGSSLVLDMLGVVMSSIASSERVRLVMRCNNKPFFCWRSLSFGLGKAFALFWEASFVVSALVWVDMAWLAVSFSAYLSAGGIGLAQCVQRASPLFTVLVLSYSECASVRWNAHSAQEKEKVCLEFGFMHVLFLACSLLVLRTLPMASQNAWPMAIARSRTALRVCRQNRNSYTDHIRHTLLE